MSKRTLYEYFKSQGMNDYGVCGLLANIQKESGFKANNLQNTGNKKLNMTDEQYTRAVDNGTYTRDEFCKDGNGYGLAQHTYFSRKAALYTFMKLSKVSIGDEAKQAEFIVKEMKTSYKGVWNTLCNAKSVKEASDKVMLEYEKPADQSAAARAERAGYGQAIYNEFCVPKITATVKVVVVKKGCTGEPIRALQGILNAKGFNCGGIDGDFGNNTDKAVRAFQKAKGLAVDGVVGGNTWNCLLN